jgi:hypothetical protein
LQEVLEVALFLPDVRVLASSNLEENLSMKRLFIAIVLGLALSISTLAGDIPISGSPIPVPNGEAQTTSTVPGDIPSVPATNQATEAVVSAVLAVLGIFAV